LNSECFNNFNSMELSNLQSLVLPITMIDNSTMARLAKHNVKLRHLDLRATKVDIGGLRILLKDNGIYLTSLVVKFLDLDDDSIGELTQMCPNLKLLDLQVLKKLTSKCLPYISDLENLEDLDLRDNLNMATDNTIDIICKKCANLKILRFRNPAVTDITLVSVVNYCPNIVLLDMQQCGVSNAGLEYLLKTEKPTILYLNFVDVPSLDEVLIEKLRKKFSNMRYMDPKKFSLKKMKSSQ